MTVDVSTLGTTEWKDLDFGKLLFFASIATVFENSLMYPFWTMKTRQQVQTGEVVAQMSIRSMGGVRALYRGFMFYSMAALPAYLVYLVTYTYSKSALGLSYSDIDSGPNSGSLGQIMAPFAAGLLADAACLGLYMPVEIVAQRLQLPTRYKEGVRHILKDMYREDGWRTFYRGFGATVMTSAVSSGVWWMTYENFKKAFTNIFLRDQETGLPIERSLAREEKKTSDTNSQTGFWAGVLGKNDYREQVIVMIDTVTQSLPHMAAGFLAGGTAALLANPMDIVKTRLQTQRIKPGPFTFFTGLKEIMQQEGIRRSFLRGIVPKIVSTAPLGLVSSLVYEGILYMSRKDPIKDTVKDQKVE